MGLKGMEVEAHLTLAQSRAEDAERTVAAVKAQVSTRH
jgi:hypothetical protein